MSMREVTHGRVRAMLVGAASMAAVIPTVGAQTTMPTASGTQVQSNGLASPSLSGATTSEPTPIGTAAFPSQVVPHTETAPPSSTASAAVPVAPTPALGQVRSQSVATVPAEPPQVPAQTSSSPNQTPDWSVGAGLGWTFSTPLVLDVSPGPAPSAMAGSMTYTPMGALGSISQPAPTAITFLERRLANGLFLLAQPEVSYFRNQYPDQEKASYTSTFALGVGLRWVGNPNAPVEVGMAHTVYVGYATTGAYYRGTLNAEGITTPTTSWATPSTKSVGTASAIVVERMLLSQLWLRVSATVLRIGWSKSEAHYELEDGASYGGESRKAVGAKFGFDPALSLRLTF